MWGEAASMQCNKWTQRVRPLDTLQKAMSIYEHSQAASGLSWSGAGGDGSSLGPLAHQKNVQSNIGNCICSHLLVMVRSQNSSIIKKSNNWIMLTCLHSLNPKPAPSGVPTTSSATSPSTSSVPTAWHPAENASRTSRKRAPQVPVLHDPVCPDCCQYLMRCFSQNKKKTVNLYNFVFELLLPMLP